MMLEHLNGLLCLFQGPLGRKGISVPSGDHRGEPGPSDVGQNNWRKGKMTSVPRLFMPSMHHVVNKR